jgi:Protein of unknown function (DUF4236)
MGWNFRRSLNLGGGFRLNLSKRGMGLSGGFRGFRFGIGPRGKRMQATLPGSGIYYRRDEGWGRPTAGAGTPLVRIAIVVAAGAALLAWLLGVISK